MPTELRFVGWVEPVSNPTYSLKAHAKTQSRQEQLSLRLCVFA
jgi:hypothetical protein